MSIFSLIKKGKKRDNSNLTITRFGGNLDEKLIHTDIRSLLWIGEGPAKNYTQPKESPYIKTLSGTKIYIQFSTSVEPSLIYPKLPIKRPNSISDISKLDYFPTYVDLSPEQRWRYHQFLSNPYDHSFEIGYIFILYYGLERHLIQGNMEQAFKVILKLRDVHSNKSFQSYSANALILTAIKDQRGDLALDFYESLDKDFEFMFPDNLFLLFHYGLNIPIQSKDIIRMSRSFGFSNQNYIKKYPELFETTLSRNLVQRFGTQDIMINDFISNVPQNEIPITDIPVFANTSIKYTITGLPLFSQCENFQSAMQDILLSTHEKVKEIVSEQRKLGTPIPEIQSQPKEKKELIFDVQLESTLLDSLKNANSFTDQHFALMNLHEFYYKYRSLDSKYTEKCISFCLEDISILDQVNNEAKAHEKLMKETIFASMSSDILPPSRMIQNYYDTKQYGFLGRIVSFERLAIIYEKQKEFQKAIDICDIAIQHYGDRDFGFELRKSKLLEKI